MSTPTDLPETYTSTRPAKRSAPRSSGKWRLVALVALLACLLLVYLVLKPQRLIRVTPQERRIIARSEAAQGFQQEEQRLQEQIRKDPGNPRWRRELATHYLRIRLWMDVAEVLEDAVRANDTDSLTLETLGEAYWNLSNREEAIQYFKRNVRLHPREVVAYLRLTHAYVDIGEPRWAEEVLRHIPPDTIQSQMLPSLARAYEQAGDFTQAGALCAQRLQSDPADVEARWISAQVLLRAGRWKEAEAALTQALRQDPNRAEMLYALGVCRTELKPGREMETAVPLWEKAVQLDPQMGLAHYDLATDYERAGRLQDAIRSYVRAYNNPPHPVEAFAGLARVYNRMNNRPLAHKAMGLYFKHRGDKQGAVREFEARLKLEPASDLGTMDLADAYQEAGRLHDAVRILQQALKQSKHPAVFNYRLANVYGALQQVTEEKGCLQRAIQLDPKGSAPEYRELCRIAMEQEGDYDRAESLIQKAIDLDPNEPDYHYTQGKVYALRASDGGRLQKAIDAFNAVLALQPTDFNSDYQLGILLQKAGRLDDAAAHLRAAISLSPTYGEAYLKLYQVYRSQGKTQRAETLMRLYNDYLRASADQDMLARRTRAHPNDPAAAEALATFYLRNGELPQAEKQYQRMAAIQPSSPAAHERLAAIYAMEGRTPDELDELHLAAQRSARQTAAHKLF